ncbi:MAG: hypothetical protein ACFB0B_00590 [Thermonemataceae bacterium]
MGVQGNLWLCQLEPLEQVVIPALKEGSGNKLIQQSLAASALWKTQQKTMVEEISQHFDEVFKHNEVYTRRHQAYEAYCSLFEFLVVTHCLKPLPVYYFGKYALKHRFEDKSKHLSPYFQSSFAYEMLVKLDQPTFWTHNSGGYHEGIRNWIDPLEVAIFLEESDQLIFQSDYKAYHEDELQALKQFLQSAVQAQCGVLNGGDLRFLEGV